MALKKAEAINMDYVPVIGLEVHVQLQTNTKMFCGCSTEFGALPNSQTCPVCLGFPGVLPVANRKAVEYAIKVALSLDCAVSDFMKFDRKNYFYPDLPKNFQISQFDKPLATGGHLDIVSGGNEKSVKIKRVHLEEDAGKLIHEKENSLVDFNRSGMPLLEIVTEPDINSPEQAYDYLSALKNILLYLEVSDCNMEQGSLRCDANLSVRPKESAKLGTKTEVKNMNTFKGVRMALEYEMARQTQMLEDGIKVIQETRLWNMDKQVTSSMRSKEEAHDYRYFPEPDLPPFSISQELVEKIAKTLPEMPAQRKKRFIESFGLSEYDAAIITGDKRMADYFEKCAAICGKPKIIANWITQDIAAELNRRGMENIRELYFSEDDLADMLRLIEAGTISGKMAKDILKEAIDTKKTPAEIVKSKGLSQISDKAQVDNIIEEVLKNNARSVEDFKSGKTNAFMFLVGQVMKLSKGKANPKVVNELLKEKLK